MTEVLKPPSKNHSLSMGGSLNLTMARSAKRIDQMAERARQRTKIEKLPRPVLDWTL